MATLKDRLERLARIDVVIGSVEIESAVDLAGDMLILGIVPAGQRAVIIVAL